jgi:RNA polymerase primary sigma factor
MIRLAKKRGYIIYDELDQVLPADEFSPQQIEDVLNQLAEMGIDLVEENNEPEDGRSVHLQRQGDNGGRPVWASSDLYQHL